MSHLGSFGAAMREIDPEAEKDTFDFFAESFTVYGNIPPVIMLQLGAAATEKIEETEGLGAMWEAMRCSLTKPEHEKDGEKVAADASQFQRWYKLAVSKCDELEDLMELAMKLFQAQAGRPTGQRSTSADGSLPTSTSSKSSPSTHPAFANYRPVAEVLAG